MYRRTTSLGFSMSHAARLMQKVMRSPLQAERINYAFLPAMLWLFEEDGLTQTDLSKRAGIEQPSMAELLNRMDQEGFLERRADPDDRRRQTLHLTRDGRDAVRRTHKWLDRSNRSLAEGIAQAEIDVTLDVLQKIIANLERQVSSSP